MIQELCAKLKAKREELGYSIEEAVEKTKLHPSVIRDIESGNLSNINPTYIRGFIKIYAAFLGVAIGDALEGIPSAVVKTKKEPKITKEPRTRRRPSLPFKKFPFKEIKKPLVFLIAGIIAFLILFMIAKAIFKGRRHKEVAEPPKIEEKAPTPKTVTKPAAELIASITAKRDCFLRVKSDGEILFEGILKKGVSESWNAKKELEFKISDGSAVYVEVNGKALPSLTTMRKPIKSLKITPSGISVEK